MFLSVMNTLLDENKVAYWYNLVVSDINESMIQLLDSFLRYYAGDSIQEMQANMKIGCLHALNNARKSLINGQLKCNQSKGKLLNFQPKNKREKELFANVKRLFTIYEYAFINEEKLIDTMYDFVDTDDLLLKFADQYSMFDIEISSLVDQRLRYKQEMIEIATKIK